MHSHQTLDFHKQVSVCSEVFWCKNKNKTLETDLLALQLSKVLGILFELTECQECQPKAIDLLIGYDDYASSKVLGDVLHLVKLSQKLAIIITHFSWF